MSGEPYADNRRGGKSGWLAGWLIDDDGSGFSIRYPSKAAAQLQIDRLARAEREAEEDSAAQRVERLAVVAGVNAIDCTMCDVVTEELRELCGCYLASAEALK